MHWRQALPKVHLKGHALKAGQCQCRTQKLSPLNHHGCGQQRRLCQAELHEQLGQCFSRSKNPGHAAAVHLFLIAMLKGLAEAVMMAL